MQLNVYRHRLLTLLFLSVCTTPAVTGVLPEDRSDALYHRYQGGGITIQGPSILVQSHWMADVLADQRAPETRDTDNPFYGWTFAAVTVKRSFITPPCAAVGFWLNWRASVEKGVPERSWVSRSSMFFLTFASSSGFSTASKISATA